MAASIPETKVLAIASHVTHGYVGNTMATFIMQSLGCEVSALNTVHYSNHTAYKQVKGSKVTAEQITELYEGLKQSYLNDFDVLLSGYIPSAEAVQAVGKIARDLKFRSSTKPGSFFWVLDPVMGDDGHLYIPEDEVPAYKSLLRDADLILPNQFEAELLSDTKINNLSDITKAIGALHRSYQIPHIVITSLRLASETDETLPTKTKDVDPSSDRLTIVGSTCTSDFTPRIFRIDVPAYPVFFSGTGDMFAALMVARLREAVFASELQSKARWQSPDDIPAIDLPLAKAAEKVLASMQAILEDTFAFYQERVKVIEMEEDREGPSTGGKGTRESELFRHLRRTKAAEVRVVRNVGMLVDPPELEACRARAVENGAGDISGAADRVADELGVVNLGIKGSEGGAVHIDTHPE